MAIARQRIHLPPGSLRESVSGLLRGRLWDGPDVEAFERAFARFVGVEGAVAVPSGRAGLLFLLEALGVPEGSEVLCSAFGYPVVPHLARAQGFDVRFVDCEMQTLGMDPARLAETISERTSVVIATHLYGVPCRIDEIARIAERNGAALIEDCAHCLGASLGGRHAGSFGAGSYFSFETSKPINTLGGGMIATRDRALAERCREIAHGQSHRRLGWLVKRLALTAFEATVTHPWVFNAAVYPALRLARRTSKGDDHFASGYHADEVTLSGRLGRYENVQARLGARQLARVGPGLARRAANAERLIGALRKHAHFQTPADPSVDANYMLVAALFPDLEATAGALLERGIDTKHHYMRDCTGLAEPPAKPGDFPNAARAEREVLHLPAYPELSDAEVDRVIRAVESVVAASEGAGSPSRA